METRTTAVQLADAIARSVDACPGVAGLDPAGRYATTGVDALHRGVRIRSGRDSSTDVEVELVGVAGVNLPAAGATARARIAETLRLHGHQPGEVLLRFTDIADVSTVQDRHEPEPAPRTVIRTPSGRSPEPPRRSPMREAIERPLTSSAGGRRVRVTVEILGDER